MRKATMLLVFGVIGLVLSGCGPRQSPIVGEIQEYGDYPIAGRKVALCQLLGSQEFEEGLTRTPVECTLLETVAVSDEKGHFEFRDVSPGIYLLFYDSGLSDFDVAVEEWAGKTLRIGDTEWLLGSFLANDKPKMPLFSELAHYMVMQGMEKTQQYMALHLMVGQSPFILAHDVDRVIKEDEISIILAIAGEENQVVRFPALYLKR